MDMQKTVIITLNGRPNSDLDWQKERVSGLQALASGKRIIWKLDLGLFRDLSKTIHDSAQFLTLGLALDHFRDFIWREFHRYSEGVVLYEGSADFLPNLQWTDQQRNNFIEWVNERFNGVEEFQNEVEIDFPKLDPLSLQQSSKGQMLLQLFASDVSGEFIDRLAMRLPDEIPCYALLLLPQTEDLLLLAQLFHPQRFGKVKLLNDDPKVTWKIEEDLTLAICMPEVAVVKPSLLDPFRQSMNLLKKRGVCYKLIPEEQLTTAWDGLNTLLFLPEALSSQGKRKVQGFIAAGGEAVSIKDLRMP